MLSVRGSWILAAVAAIVLVSPPSVHADAITWRYAGIVTGVTGAGPFSLGSEVSLELTIGTDATDLAPDSELGGLGGDAYGLYELPGASVTVAGAVFSRSGGMIQVNYDPWIGTAMPGVVEYFFPTGLGFSSDLPTAWWNTQTDIFFANPLGVGPGSGAQPLGPLDPLTGTMRMVFNQGMPGAPVLDVRFESVSAVPEPSTLSLVAGSGLLAAALRRAKASGKRGAGTPGESGPRSRG
jgi:hypothetical protein